MLALHLQSVEPRPRCWSAAVLRPRADPPLFQVPGVDRRFGQGPGQAGTGHCRRRRVLVSRGDVGEAQEKSK